MMANDHDGNPGGQQKSPEELEREERMRLAMIEELGIHRLDELPMEDTHKASYDDRHPRKPQLEERPSRRNRGKDVILASGDLGSVWQAAIKDGVFEDDDAAGVRGLDDLGGARRYDTARRGVQPPVPGPSISSESHGITRHDSRPPNAGTRKTHEAAARTRRLLNVMNNNMMPSARRRTKVASINVMQAISSNAPISMGNNSDKEQRHPRRAVAAPPAPAPQQQFAAPVVNPSLPTANVTGAADAANAVVPESEDTLLRTEVLFRRPNETSPMPSTVLLSSGGPPGFGHFTVLVNDVKFCQWAIATYDDYLNSEDLEVCFLFHHGLGYSFTFKTQDQLVRFLNVLKDLKKAAVTGICLTSHPLPVQQSTTVAAPLPQAPTIQKPVPEPGLPAIPRTAPPSPPDLLTSNTQICQSQEIVRPSTQAPEARAKLVSLDAESGSTAPSRAPSEASELLSTLEPPYDSTKKTELQSPASFIKSIRAVARVFLGTFYLNGKAGQTKAEIAETIQGIREGIIQHFEDDETLTVEERQLIEPALFSIFEEMINNPPAKTAAPKETLGGEIAISSRPSALATDQAKPLSPTTSTSSGSSRIQYDSDEMKAMRENAVAPSTDLGSLKFLPKPGEPKMSEPQPGPSVRVWESSQLVASTSAMDWVMGAEAKPADESAEKQPLEDQVVKATQGHKPVVAAQQPNKADVGLQQSRWAKPGAEIQQANAFTGGQYEKFWKQGSYYYDLIVLDRNAQLGCTSTETIMDMFYPETNGEIAMPSNSSQPRLRSDSQLISIETASTGSTDHVEHLRRGIERMTIRSQRGASAASSRPGSEAQPSASFMPLAPLPVQQASPSSNVSAHNARTHLPGVENQPVRQPVQPPAAKGLRGLGASRHSGGNAPVTSGKFDFVLPKSGGK